MKYIKLFEEFEEFKKPSLLQRAVKGTKRFFHMENKEDRETIEKIYRAINASPVTSGGYKVDFVTNVREAKPGVMIAWILGKSLTVDDNDKTIMYAGKELELSDMDYECDALFNRLYSIIDTTDGL